MTTLSILEMNMRSRQCRVDSRNAYSMHRRVMSLFPKADSGQARSEFGVLWRIEPSESPTLLIQSRGQPDFTRLPGEYGRFRSKSIDRHLSSLERGHVVNYRAVVNPVRSSRAGGQNKQTAIPFCEQAEWWQAREQRIGLTPLDAPVLTGQPARNLYRDNGDRARVPIYSIRVDGIAEVVDADSLREAIEGGVGRAKAWGCGLLTVARFSAQ
ncbi:type I-E CRISPR-associated protein Cas6/Cse3/CasE [Candidatus Poriferisocius sp.]|uniref:type I-E CRISPR-associated protein Cas6/Cse3/CasE n=1 Tax=Candidatus Poriferisocius sp. TaxID=3101276 RepID=UPI003B010E3D